MCVYIFFSFDFIFYKVIIHMCFKKSNDMKTCPHVKIHDVLDLLCTNPMVVEGVDGNIDEIRLAVCG